MPLLGWTPCWPGLPPRTRRSDTRPSTSSSPTSCAARQRRSARIEPTPPIRRHPDQVRCEPVQGPATVPRGRRRPTSTAGCGSSTGSSSDCRGDDADARILTVVGPSGSGKSSAVRAGLLPRRVLALSTGSQRWFLTAMVPGAHPFEELEAALGASRDRHRSAESAESMASERRGHRPGRAAAVADDTGQLLVVIDQFEELFTLCADPTSVTGLPRRPRRSDDRADDPRCGRGSRLRADFFDRPLASPRVGPTRSSAARSP